MLTLRLADPGRVIVGWPELPLLALTTIVGGRTRVIGFDPGGDERWAALVDDELRGGLVADLDGDGVGELYAWSDTTIHAIDLGGRARVWARVPTPPPLPALQPDPSGRHSTHRSRPAEPGAPMPWERGPVAPRVVDRAGGRVVVADGGVRGDVATPAALLVRPAAAVTTAALERIFDGGPTVAVVLRDVDGQRLGWAPVGRYDLRAAPFERFLAAQRPETALFGAEVAPLAVVGATAADDVVVVPYLVEAPGFGPVIVAIAPGGGACDERWRERVTVRADRIVAPPILCDLDGDGGAQVLWSDGARMERRDAATGRARPAIAHAGVPIAALDVGGRGRVQLVVWHRDGIDLIAGGRCQPGAVLWLPMRGDLWRSGALGPDRNPVGPRS